MFKLTVHNYWRDVNNYQQEKKQLFYKINHFYMQFSVKVNRFIVKTLLNSTLTNDLKRKENFSKNVYSCRLCLFKANILFVGCSLRPRPDAAHSDQGVTVCLQNVL